MELQLKGKKILFGTVPADGHFNPLTGLAVFLKQQGCDVRWYTSPIFKEKLDRLNIQHYPFVKALDVTGNNLQEVFPERNDIKDAAAKLEFDLINVFGDRATEYFEDIKDIYQTFEFDLMIGDSFFSVLPFVKHKLNVPVIAIGIVPLAEDSVDLAPYGMGFLPPGNDAERNEYANLRALVKTAIFKNSIDRFSATLDEYHIPHEKSIIFDLLIRQADFYLQIGSPGFEYGRSDVGGNVRYVGALLPAVSKSSDKVWFDERVKHYTKIVLVTQGTVERDTSKLIVPVLEALKDTDVLVIATTAGHDTAELRQMFPHQNLIVEDYIPYNTIMPFVDLYITNGGYSGTLLSIKHRLPILAAGLYEGKNEICSRIGYFNIGINLNTETPEPQQITEAVEELLTDPMYKRNVENLANELGSYDSNTLCAAYINELIGERADIRAGI
ncbi:glycosyltransferase [Pedobacter sp. MC2016-15]|uniref:glycosyltransferase n=1 Tax=Pedobacter sp. MC2016-15 TaxID=2994473 RepID=UPI002247548C|nr:nucleotide disphospho-sugar-binding domain-containing protein [Pedobacter sp. MC2016-15]MCX2480540.1 glycosyltransferase [Pedobacter sp. MC2016-15]